MPHALLESLRNALIAAHYSDEPALRRLALSRYDAAWRAISRGDRDAQPELHARLYRMLPSDWPLWVECYRRAPATVPLSRARAG
jgi:hypothetical protein